jgi:hypothetical protein
MASENGNDPKPEIIGDKASGANDKPSTLTDADVEKILGRSNRSRGREFVLWAAVVVALIGTTTALLYVFVWMKPAPPMLMPGPNPLADEVEIEGYLVRPPLGYPKVAPKTTPGAKHFFWGGTKRADGMAPVFAVTIGTPPRNERPQSLDQGLREFLGGFQRGNATDWATTPFSEVRINDLVFVQTRWSGINVKSGRKTHGFNFLAMDGGTAIVIYSQDVEPHHEEALKLSESAAASFRRK